VLLLVASMNAWNFFDNHDGCASLAGIVTGAFLLLRYHGSAFLPSSSAAPPPGDPGHPLRDLGGLCLACLLAFLPWNWPHARAYLGDMGSHFCGMLLGLCSLAAWQVGNLGLALGIQGIVAVDLVQVCIVRLATGHPPWQADRRHLAHRLDGFLPSTWIAPALAFLQALCLWILAGVTVAG